MPILLSCALQSTIVRLLIRHTHERYAFIITDLVIRAVDIELLDNMTADQVLYGYRRIAARKSFSKFQVSDNDAQQFNLIHKTILKQYNHDITWKCIPEYSPWQGGIYERLIVLINGTLCRTFHGKALSDTVLCTAFAEIAITLNLRPITYVTENNEDRSLTPKKPNDFLKITYRVDLLCDATVPQIVTAGHLTDIWK